MAMTENLWKAVYSAANKVVIAVGYSGSIESDHPAIMELMCALADIDDGVFDVEKAFWKGVKGDKP